MGTSLSEARRSPNEEPLTQLDVNIDTRDLDSSVEGEVLTSPGMDPPTSPGADDEPQTMEPPKVMGAPRLRAHTIHGVAPPSSSGATAPPSTSPASSDIRGVPKIHVEGDDEQTTLVGKMLADARAEVRGKLKEQPKDGDLYQDETATTVTDAETLIATANAAAFAKDRNDSESDEVDEPTESRSLNDASMEETTSRRDAINIEEALAKAALLKAEAERKKRQLKKQTIHGLGMGPLTLPARPPRVSDDDVPTFDSKTEALERAARSEAVHEDPTVGPHAGMGYPADGEMETLSGGSPQPAPFARARTMQSEPETMPVNIPLPPPRRDRNPTSPAQPTDLLSSGAPSLETGPQPALQSPYTQPMPYAPTVRMEDGPPSDMAFQATMQSHGSNSAMPMPMPALSPHQLHGTPPGGVPHYHSTPMPMGPHSGPGAFARTAVASRSQPMDDPPEKKSRTGLVFFFMLLVVFGAAGYWKRAIIKDSWHRYRHPGPVATTAQPAPSVAPSMAPSTAPSVAASAGPVTSSSAAPHASSSAAPHASSSAAPHASASASASASAKPAAKKPPPWKPPPPKPKPKVTPPKPIDDGRGF